MSLTKQIKAVWTLALAAVLLLLPLLSPASAAHANSAAPIRPDSGSGIVFRQHEHVQIQKEVLDIQINDDTTADITATYTMKNTSNSALSVETMFLTPVEYGDNEGISVKRNQAELPFTQEFYGLTYHNGSEDVAQTIEDWESIVSAVATPSEPLGDGTGFWEYRIRHAGATQLYASFSPQSIYFYQATGFDSTGAGTVTLSCRYDSWNTYSCDIVIVTEQQFEPQTNGSWSKTEIADIYDYLLTQASENAAETQLRFAEQQFNLYLHELDVDVLAHHLFYLNYIVDYVSAITYYVDFEPSEELELTVSYTYQMGTSGYRYHADLLYYLSPAKYWKDFAEIQITFTLSDEYSVLHSSSLDFTKIDDRHYTYTATSLPSSELRLTVSNGSAISNVWSIIALIVSSIGLMFACSIVGTLLAAAVVLASVVAIILLIAAAIVKSKRKA